MRYVETSRRLGAEAIVLVGTEPLRRAADAPIAVEDVQRATGVPLDILTHEEEGHLTLIGVTSGRRVAAELMVVDIGGGSSELVVVGAGTGVRATGLKLGSARLTASIVRHDPPTAAEIEHLAREARRILAGAPDASPRDVIAVGGTASNVIRVLPAATLDRTLTRRRIADALRILASEPWALAAERHAVHPVRARILPAGAAILDAILERYGVERVRISDAGIREGAVLAAIRAGDRWRERLPELAPGWVG